MNVISEIVLLPSFSSQVEFQVPVHDGVFWTGVTGVVVIAGDSSAAVVAAGEGVVAGPVPVQPDAASMTQRVPARIRTRDFFMMISVLSSR